MGTDSPLLPRSQAWEARGHFRSADPACLTPLQAHPQSLWFSESLLDFLTLLDLFSELIYPKSWQNRQDSLGAHRVLLFACSHIRSCTQPEREFLETRPTRPLLASSILSLFCSNPVWLHTGLASQGFLEGMLARG